MELFEMGKVYSASKINKIELMNFPSKNSFKVVPFFNEIKEAERIKIKEKIDEICKIELRTGDTLGMLMTNVMYLYMLGTDMVVVNTDGLSNQSILFLEENLSVMAEKLNKVAIVNRNFI